ncbi:MAG: hypothetical protein ABR505_02870 [Actinomycetota bacterium]
MSGRSALNRVANVLKWFGFAWIAFGVLGSAYTALVLVRAETGFALTRADECCSQLGIIALGTVLASMFFVLIGAILLLVSRIFEQAPAPQPRSTPGWLRWVPGGLFLYGICIFALTAVLASNANQLGDIAGEIVTFCVFSFVGLILVASGIRRTRELNPHGRPPVSR